MGAITEIKTGILAISLVAAFAGGLASMGGYALMWKADYDNLSDNLDRQKKEAEDLLKAEKQKAADRDAQNKLDNEAQAKANEDNSKTIDNLRQSLADARLYDPGRRPSSKSAKPTGNGAGQSQAEAEVPTDAPGSSAISRELESFIKINFYNADQVAEYATQCYAFVVERNCGIAKE